jgi:hypothetical protein
MCLLVLSNKAGQTFNYMILAIVTFLSISALFVVIHEYIHSTAAWILGAKENPLKIQWGNPITLTGWGENVCYSCLFDSGWGSTAAIIAASPLVFQAQSLSYAYILCWGTGS